jgi:aryl-alcohol dehydrogenase-like predicted oxidoreductase
VFLPLAEQHNIGVIAKRPIANVAWHNGSQPPRDSYGRTYWERLQKLRYEFLQKDLDVTVAAALRFTLSVPGVHTAIVGTTKLGRFAENGAVVAGGPLPNELFKSIRARWREVAQPSWVGQT